MNSNGTKAGGGRAEAIEICYYYNITRNPKPNGATWDGYNTLDYVFLNLLTQIICVVLLSRFLTFLLKPLGQPRVVAEILSGLLLGPSVLGNWGWFADTIFPKNSINVLETMSNLSLLYFMFMAGVQMDLSMIKKTGKKATVIAISGMAVLFILGMILAKSKGAPNLGIQLFFGVVCSVTAFPVVARALAELKLINTQVGQMAMSCALLTDAIAWIVLGVAVVLAEEGTPNNVVIGIVLTYAGFFIFCFYIVQPLVVWFIRRTPPGENCKDAHLCIVLMGVVLSGIITNCIGIPTIFGAFVYGLVIPIGPFGAALVDNLEDFVFGLLFPLFFTANGMNTDLKILLQLNIMQWSQLLLVIITACGARVGIILLLAICCKMSFHEGLALGLLMNTKGVTELIIINIGRDNEIVDEIYFSIMVTISVVTTCIVTPMLMAVYKPVRQHGRYTKTIQSAKPGSELRVLACIHTHRSVPSIINLFEASQHNKRHPMFVYALHLMELTERESSILMVHNKRKPGDVAVNQTQAQSDYIINTIEEYKKQGGILPIQPIISVSPFSTMHEDICIIAEDKRVSFIILPFHKHQTIDGSMECTNPAHRTINQNVLVNAPCSVGIFVDRGLGSSKMVGGHQISQHVVVLFFGGPDDREALTYALRMVEDPSIRLTILRFLPGEEVMESKLLQHESTHKSVPTIITDTVKEKQIDDEFINGVLMKIMHNMSVLFIEKIVSSGAETVNVLRSIDKNHDLYIVGRGTGTSSVTDGLTEWNECPELGIFGDILASTDFALTGSVLVVHKFVGIEIHNGTETPDSSGRGNKFYVNMENIGSTTSRFPLTPQR